MNTGDELTKQPAQLVTIERAVAFVIGPIVVAGSAWLSAWLSTKVGIEVSPGEITGAAATGGIGAAGLIYKWLDGRSQHTLQQGHQEIEKFRINMQNAGISSSDQQNVIHIAEDDLHQILDEAVNRGHKAAIIAAQKLMPSADPSVPEIQDEPIEASPHDPAPATPVAPPIPLPAGTTEAIPVSAPTQ